MKKLRYAMIGCGGIATSKHYSALKEVENQVEVVAVCDIIIERAIRAKEHFNLTDADVYTDYKELLKDNTIDAVMVLTPNRSHSYISIDAMNAGMHVLCEKPMAINAKEAKQMLDTSIKTNRVLSIAYQNRFRQDSLYVKESILNDELGEIYYAKAHALRRRGVPTWGVFTNEYEQGGGPLIDIGTHSLDLCLWFMDNYEPKMVVGSVFKKLKEYPSGNTFGDWDPDTFNVEDSAFGFIVMKNGATIYLESSWALNIINEKEAKATLCGVKGGFDMNDGLRFNQINHSKQVETIVDTTAHSVPFFDGVSNSFEALEAQNFIDSITNLEKQVVKPHQAYVVTQILEAIYESSKDGKPVYFE